MRHADVFKGSGRRGGGDSFGATYCSSTDRFPTPCACWTKRRSDSTAKPAKVLRGAIGRGHENHFMFSVLDPKRTAKELRFRFTTDYVVKEFDFGSRT
jgi:hypothetical protein